MITLTRNFKKNSSTPNSVCLPFWAQQNFAEFIQDMKKQVSTGPLCSRGRRGEATSLREKGKFCLFSRSKKKANFT